MYFLYKRGSGIAALIEALFELIIAILVLYFVFSVMNGSSSNVKGEIIGLNNQTVEVSWNDKLGDHTKSFNISDLGKSASISRVGDPVKLHVKIYGALDKLSNTLNMENNKQPENEEVQLKGLKIWFFQRWFR